MNVERSRRMSRDEAMPLVQRLLRGDTADEAQTSELLAALEHGLRCPHISDYIFWDFDAALTAEKVVDRAMAYKPIPL
ncbi:e9imm peptide [Streptomyces sp. NPDC046977]|uniref:e9imm peptide n=1 Tax=Streptomyces sp. NPDC046977 TaxID=3154703 RepID=UPI0033D614B1